MFLTVTPLSNISYSCLICFCYVLGLSSLWQNQQCTWDGRRVETSLLMTNSSWTGQDMSFPPKSTRMSWSQSNLKPLPCPLSPALKHQLQRICLPCWKPFSQEVLTSHHCYLVVRKIFFCLYGNHILESHCQFGYILKSKINFNNVRDLLGIIHLRIFF